MGRSYSYKRRQSVCRYKTDLQADDPTTERINPQHYFYRRNACSTNIRTLRDFESGDDRIHEMPFTRGWNIWSKGECDCCGNFRYGSRTGSSGTFTANARLLGIGWPARPA